VERACSDNVYEFLGAAGFGAASLVGAVGKVGVGLADAPGPCSFSLFFSFNTLGKAKSRVRPRTSQGAFGMNFPLSTCSVLGEKNMSEEIRILRIGAVE
jgi:hypothetical protein